ncbi:MAG: hypothetical protein ABI843_07265 [Dokdonella sp.]
MWLSDSTSSQAAQRQRRHAADEKQRVDRASNEMAVREEGVARQAGEAPTRDEVHRFRALMQAGSQSQQPATKATVRAEGNVSLATTAADRPTPAPPPTVVDRFRALFQRTTDTPTPAMPEDGHAQDDRLLSARALRVDGGIDGSNASETDTTSQADDMHADARTPEGDAAQRMPAAASKVADADGRRAPEGKSPTVVPKHDDAADAAQRSAEQAARGEVQVAPIARKSRGDEDAAGDADTLSRSAVSSALPSMTQVDMPAPQQRMPDAPQQMAAAAGMIAPALAELIEKHVKQMLVSDTRGSRLRSRELLLRMQSDLLPGTDLWLTRTDGGWKMRADVRSRDAYDTLLANQDDLIRRFADGALGELSIDPVFHG